MCHWACHVQFEYSWEDKQYLGTCEFLTQPPDCRSRSPSLNQLQSEWLKSDPGKKKKSPKVSFPFNIPPGVFSTAGRVSSQGQGSQDLGLKHSSRKVKMWNYAANEPQTVDKSLSPVREAGKAVWGRRACVACKTILSANEPVWVKRTSKTGQESLFAYFFL